MSEDVNFRKKEYRELFYAYLKDAYSQGLLSDDSQFLNYIHNREDIESNYIMQASVHNKTLETAIIYIDACASAVGIANGLFIFFRLREQWIAWYICAFLEAVINIMSGQYVLLPLKLGYFTNTTYGYIKWSRYIKEHQNKEKVSLF